MASTELGDPEVERDEGEGCDILAMAESQAACLVVAGCKDSACDRESQ